MNRPSFRILSWLGEMALLVWIALMVYNMITLAQEQGKIGEIDQSYMLEKIQDWKMNQNGYKYVNDRYLCGLADERVNEIQQDFSHEGFRTKEESIWAETSFESFAENLIRNFPTAELALEAWLASPSHAENLEAPYTRTCVRCEVNHCVQVFAR